MEGDKGDMVDYAPESYDAVYYLINEVSVSYNDVYSSSSCS